MYKPLSNWFKRVMRKISWKITSLKDDAQFISMNLDYNVKICFPSFIFKHIPYYTNLSF